MGIDTTAMRRCEKQIVRTLLVQHFAHRVIHFRAPRNLMNNSFALPNSVHTGDYVRILVPRRRRLGVEQRLRTKYVHFRLTQFSAAARSLCVHTMSCCSHPEHGVGAPTKATFGNSPDDNASANCPVLRSTTLYLYRTRGKRAYRLTFTTRIRSSRSPCAYT